MIETTQLKVFIIILNWNGLNDTLECLESVYKLAYSNFEVIVVDNASSDNSVEIIQKNYPQVIMIENKENLGFASGNNVAMRYAMEHYADYVWLLNNDAVVETDTLRNIVRTAESNSQIGMVSPVIYYYDKPNDLQYQGSYIIREKFSLLKVENIDKYNFESLNLELTLWGTALLIKRCVIESIGYLDEKYFAYVEDADYSIRANNMGFRNVIEFNAKIYHKRSRSTEGPKSNLQVFLRVRNIFFFWMKHLNRIKKISFLRHYLLYVISYAGGLKKENLHEASDACLDGAWSAFQNQGGSWLYMKKMPIFLKIAFYFCFSKHPYFWSMLLRGEFIKLASEVFKRIKIKIFSKVF
jgi:GT2 family glycosyltransferase